jgi:ankyrin repeat protein
VIAKLPEGGFPFASKTFTSGKVGAVGILLRAFRPFLVILFVAFAVVLAPRIFPDHGTVYKAILAGDEGEVRVLLDRGADPNSRQAVLSEISRFLTERNHWGATPDFREQTPLVIIAIVKHQYGIAQLRRERGADPNARDKAGYTVLAHAVLSGNPDLVKLLLARGADPNARMPDGATILREGPASGSRLRVHNPEIFALVQAASGEPPR